MFVRLSSLILLVLSLNGFLNAQSSVFYNNGAVIGISDDVDVYVDFDLNNNNTGGLISNAGRLTVKGNFINSSTVTGGSFANQPLGRDTGVFNIYGDWENNQTFIADESTVKLLGSQQHIRGSSVTTFHRLEALQTVGSIKKLDNVDAVVSHVLVLKNGIEFSTGNNILRISGTDPNAIIYDDDAFVSSTTNGRLSRATASVSDYYFPLGSSVSGTPTIRPLMIKPSSAAQASFDACFVHNDPTTDGLDVNIKAPNIEFVNNRFYHLIHQTSGNIQPAEMTIFYKTAADGNFSSIGRWQGQPRWEDLIADLSQAASPYDRITKSQWSSSSAQAHALITNRNIKEYEFPTVFSPNNDGQNDRFGLVQGSVATLLSLKIYNRWGQLVFDKEKNNADFWDGTYNGASQPQGTYMMHASLKLLNGEIKNEVRPVTLIY
ncbi:MAG: gliding motility-associated C-terminal domain-containing protein [Chitinophagales bacterium]|nr:gliding motility-associated C-terminal domain-containing protein [Chitinophagales bacterium]MDW8274241.1 gliding motility-associated C-terminal domain-containing protein [Chitinophagales bacterium]